MPWDGDTGTVHLDVERTQYHPSTQVLDVWVRNIVGLDIIAGGFPVRVSGVEVEPVPDSRGHLEVSWDSVMDPDIHHYEYSLRYTYEETWGLPTGVGNVTQARIVVLPQEVVSVRVRAVNVSGAGEWSFPVDGQGGFIEGRETGTWGELVVGVSHELAWDAAAAPPTPVYSRFGWGGFYAGVLPVTWSSS